MSPRSTPLPYEFLQFLRDEYIGCWFYVDPETRALVVYENEKALLSDLVKRAQDLDRESDV